MVKSLEEDLKFWRAERPDEWTMDEFIRKAKKLEKQSSALLEALEELLYGTFPDGVDDDGSGRIRFSDACVKRYNKAKAAIAAASGNE